MRAGSEAENNCSPARVVQSKSWWDTKRSPAAGGFALLLLLLVVAVTPALAAKPPSLLAIFGPDGTASSNFERAAGIAVDQKTHAVYVIDHGNGSLYKFNESGQPLDFGGSAPYISGNRITGLSYLLGSGESQVAVDSEDGTIYVTSENTVRAFKEDGEAAEFSAGPGAGTDEIGGFTELLGVAVDVNGDIYASDYGPGGEGVISIYAPDGEALTELHTLEPANIAVASDGSLYVVHWHSTVAKVIPDLFPVTSATTYSDEETFDSENSLSLAANPANGDLYVAESEGRIARYNEEGARLAVFGAPGEEGELGGTEGVSVDGSSSRTYASGLSIEEGGSQVEIFGPTVVSVAPPSGDLLSVSRVTSDSADLEAEINPNTLATTYHFEYGLGDCFASPGSCASFPVPAASIPADREAFAVSQHVVGLQSGSVYSYRVVARNSLGQTLGPTQTFTTQSNGGSPVLPDGRAWELVSPAQKTGGGKLLPPALGFAQAAENGEALSYETFGTIGTAPEGSRAYEPTVSLVRHQAAGWSSAEITPPQITSSPIQFGTPYRLFSSDLSTAVVESPSSPLLSPEASERTPYVRDNFGDPVHWRPLVTGKEGYANVPPGTRFGGEPDEPLREPRPPIRMRAATPDLEHIVLASQIALSSDADEAFNGQSSGNVGNNTPTGVLYEWSAGKLQLISALPPGEGGDATLGFVGSAEAKGQGSVDNAVSNDGRYVFWSKQFTFERALYVRDTFTSKTLRLDTVQPGASGSGVAEPVFQGASSDGTLAFFTDTQQLTSNSNATESAADLYECEVVQGDDGPKCNLQDLTPGEGGKATGVQGVVSALNEAGTYVYFVANGVLAPGATAGKCGPAARASATCNLYVAHVEGGKWSTRFIASLSIGDSPDWGVTFSGSGTYLRLGAASPDGNYFTFMSNRNLKGYDNRDIVSHEADEEVFLYDARAHLLHCISCNPSGARPQGAEDQSDPSAPWMTDWQSLWSKRWLAANLPDPNLPETSFPAYYQPRVVTDTGRVFFNAFDNLVPADANGASDAYEFEPDGVGDCVTTSSGAAVVHSDGGCVALLSSGTSGQETGVLDASASGDDVFFLTAAALSGQDADSAYDIYDAHVCGIGWQCGSPSPPLPAPCSSAGSCRPVQGAQVVEAGPGTSQFSGGGNVKPKHIHSRHKKHHKKKKQRGHKQGKHHKQSGRKHRSGK
jgi:hypothetical protein